MNASTRRQYDRLLRRFAAFQTGHPHLGLEEQVRAWLATLSPSMGATGYQALKLAYGPQVAWHTVRKPRPRRNEARLYSSLLSSAEREHLRDTLQSPRDWALVESLWTLRRAEVARAHWRDVDLGKGMIYVTGKGGKPTWTLLPESAQIALAEWFRASGEPPDDAPVFPGRWSGKSLSPGQVGNLVRRALCKAGLYQPWRGAHAFRRTFATAWLKANPGDLRGLQRVLRHEAITTTTLYDWPRPEDLAPRLARVDL